MATMVSTIRHPLILTLTLLVTIGIIGLTQGGHLDIDCPARWFNCGNGRCIFDGFRCDGEDDCGNQRDEEGCFEQSTTTPIKMSCPADHFHCDEMCIPNKWRCDGNVDCLDKSDEANCSNTIAECNGFLCHDMKCIAHKWICDGTDDCSDGSDEHNCTRTPERCNTDKGFYSCSDGTCINVRRVCDGTQDCPRGDDEGPMCKNSCRNATRCGGSCRVTPHGDQCYCPTGFKLNADGRTCDDIDECASGNPPGGCSHMCHNKRGAFQCTCHEGYKLDTDNRTCIAMGPEPLMIFTDGKQMRGYWLFSDRYFPIRQSFRQALGVDMYNPDEMIFWVDAGSARSVVHSCTRHGVDSRPIITSGLQKPEDVAVDWLGKNIYVTDAGYKRIIACTLDGTVCTPVVSDGVDKPRAIALDPSHGMMYWTDWGRRAGVYQAGMDGSNVTTLVNSSIAWPNGVTYDWATHRIFWTDAKLNKIESLDLRTHERQVVISETVNHPYALTLFEDYLYWSDWESYSLERCNKFTGRNQTVILREAGAHIFGVHIYHPALNPTYANPCWANHCSHMCLIAPNDTYTCACPGHLELDSNRLTCVAKKDPFLLVAVEKSVKKVYPETIGRDVIVDIPIPHQVAVGAMTYDWDSDTLYIFDENKLSILAINTSVIYDYRHAYMRSVVSSHIESVEGLTYDPTTKNLFWLDSTEGLLEVATTDFKPPATTSRAVILRNLDRPIDLALYPEEAALYIAVLGSDPHILVADTDGRNANKLVPSARLGLPVSLFLDRSHGTLYWADARRAQIMKLDLFTESSLNKRARVIRDHVGHVMSIAMDNVSMYWTDMDSSFLYHVGIRDRFDQPTMVQLPSSDDKSAVKKLLYIRPDYAPSPCLENRGGCTDICLVGRNKRASCACPTGKKLLSDGFTCAEERESCQADEWLCDDGLKCIADDWKCDGTPDCADLSDEKNCTAACPNGDFRCDNKRCILAVWRCDHMDDCGDGSDELRCGNVEACPSDHFNCGHGQCIPYMWACDGEADCSTGDDERHCNATVCPKSGNNFRCHSGQCVPDSWKCDGEADCIDASDEINCHIHECGKSEFRCRNNFCIDKNYVCDRENDCEDGSDEINCNYPPKVCSSAMVACPNDGNCIFAIDMCDGHLDCADGWDESNCTATQCSGSEVPCHPENSTHLSCIPSSWLCDGENDCGDWSDENRDQCLRVTPASPTSDSACHDDSFPCTSGECIPWAKVCNRRRDCLDASDEGGHCEVSCTEGGGGCAQVCRNTPYGPRCECHPGYRLMADGKTCEDVDECQHEGICSQQCENTKGSYKCSCADGYKLAQDHHRCKANGTEAQIIFALPNEVRSIGLSSHSVHGISHLDEGEIRGMDYDIRNGLVFWTEANRNAIMARDVKILNGSAVEQVSAIEKPVHLSWDWIALNFYYTNENNNIRACDQNGTYCALLLHTNVPHINSFMIDPKRGLMFWSIWSSGIGANSGRIERADMDGQNRRILLNDELYWPSGLTVDPISERIYWVDTKRGEISFADLSGRNRKSLLSYSLSHPKSLALFEDNLYWANYGSDTIMRCNKFTGGSRLIVHRGHVKAQVLRVAHKVHQIQSFNPCLNSTCDHLCVLRPDNGSACMCRDGYDLSSDRSTCILSASAEGLVDMESCDRVVCLNGGFCSNGSSFIECVCTKDYSGPFCQFSRVHSAGGSSIVGYLVFLFLLVGLVAGAGLFLAWYYRPADHHLSILNPLFDRVLNRGTDDLDQLDRLASEEEDEAASVDGSPLNGRDSFAAGSGLLSGRFAPFAQRFMRK